jgi:hypothetical protein
MFASYAAMAIGIVLSFLGFIAYVLVAADCPTCGFSLTDLVFVLAGPLILLCSIVNVFYRVWKLPNSRGRLTDNSHTRGLGE